MRNDRRTPVKNRAVKTRNETFGKLLVAGGLPILCINKDGEAIWDLCDGKRDVASIVNMFAEGAPPNELPEMRKLIGEFLDEAARLGLITFNEDTA